MTLRGHMWEVLYYPHLQMGKLRLREGEGLVYRHMAGRWQVGTRQADSGACTHKQRTPLSLPSPLTLPPPPAWVRACNGLPSSCCSCPSPCHLTGQSYISLEDPGVLPMSPEPLRDPTARVSGQKPGVPLPGLKFHSTCIAGDCRQVSIPLGLSFLVWRVGWWHSSHRVRVR